MVLIYPHVHSPLPQNQPNVGTLISYMDPMEYISKTVSETERFMEDLRDSLDLVKMWWQRCVPLFFSGCSIEILIDSFFLQSDIFPFQVELDKTFCFHWTHTFTFKVCLFSHNHGSGTLPKKLTKIENLGGTHVPLP